MLSKLKVKYIQSLGQKKFRDEHNVFVAEGPKTVLDLAKESSLRIQAIYALPEWLSEYRKAFGSTEIVELSEMELEKISLLKTPNEVLAIVEKPLMREIDQEDEGIILALDSIQDPGNLGTIIRIADWFGVKNIVCNEGCADIYNPKVVQATMGSIARVNCFYTDLAIWLQQNEKLRVYATVLDGQPITKMNKISSGIILVGNESRGISGEILERANVRITIPKLGGAESLNAAVATGIILSHVI
jgi:TrmH family RNA methyltransferase